MVSSIRYARLLLMGLVSLGTCSAVSGTPSKTAQRCGANQEQPPARVFAAPQGKKWREYKDVKAIPKLELNGGSAARLWKGTDENVLVTLQEPGEDFAAYTDYCFSGADNLLFVRYELRTAWRWGYRQEGAIVGGKLTLDSSEFFDTKTDRRIEKPQQADDIPEALKPLIYAKKSDLPFFRLLAKL